ncbi:hypothetical protein BC835DRAFT_1396628 [Cytidiella melzeri]|nr:hypothetical protein BC835DRAFT_1396628 [Cytidiella melzeri]
MLLPLLLLLSSVLLLLSTMLLLLVGPPPFYFQKSYAVALPPLVFWHLALGGSVLMPERLGIACCYRRLTSDKSGQKGVRQLEIKIMQQILTSTEATKNVGVSTGN